MFKIFESNVKITNTKEITEKLTVGSLYCTHKEGSEYIKTFIECKIVGNGLKRFKELGLKDKDRFTIIEGVIRNEPFTNKEGKKVSKLVLTIFELKEYTKAIEEE